MLARTAPSTTPRRRVPPLLILGVLTLVGLLLRLWSLDFGLPLRFRWPRPDEEVVVDTALRAIGGDPSPRFFHYPTLFIYATAVGYGLLRLLESVAGIFTSLDGQFARFGTDSTVYFLVPRAISAGLGAATIPAVYALGKRAFSSAVGLVAAALLCGTFLHVRDSHFGVTDVAMTFLVTVAHVAILAVRTRPSLRSSAIAGALCGLATSTKYSAALLVLPLVLAHMPWPGEWRYGVRRAAGPCVAALTIMLLAFVLGSPFVVADWSTFVEHFSFESRHLVGGHGQDLGLGWGRHLSFSLRYGMGAALLTAGLSGIALAFHRRSFADLLLLSFPLATYLTIGAGRTVFVRYMVPMLPLLCLLAARLLVDLRSVALPLFDRRPLLRGMLLPGMVAALLLEPVWRSVRYDRLVGRDDTRALAQRWVLRHVSRATTVVEDGLDSSALLLEGYRVVDAKTTARFDRFSARWSAAIDLTDSRAYRFRVAADGGARLRIGTELLIDAWNSEGRTTHEAVRSLSRGRHRVRLDYVERHGRAGVRLEWADSAMGPWRLLAPPDGFAAEVFGDEHQRRLSFRRADPVIDFHWRDLAPFGPDEQFIVIATTHPARPTSTLRDPALKLLGSFDPRVPAAGAPLYDEIDSYIVPYAHLDAVSRPGPLVHIYQTGR